MGRGRNCSEKRLLVKVGATEEVTAHMADELAAAVLKPGGAGGAEAAMVLGREAADRGCREGFGIVFGGEVHKERVDRI
jgi:hypothetical protein